MKELNDTLPELMRRATENLEPESSDLVERGMRRGATLRRRRTALLTASGATAVLATAGVVIGGSQLFAKDAPPPVASTTASQATTKATAAPTAKPVTSKESLTTLLKLLPPRFKIVKTDDRGDDWGNRVTVFADDGKGLAMLSLSVWAPGVEGSCSTPQKGTCVPRPDGSRITARENEPTYEKGNNPGGVLHNSVSVLRPGKETISLMSFNAMAEKESTATRAKPALSVAELTAIADSKLWRFPPQPPAQPAGPTKPVPHDPGAGKPGVPVQQTLQTLKKVLPSSLSLSRPETWGGGTQGHNGAAYLVNDGKGLSRVDAFLTYENPVTKCTAERSTTFCEVRADGSVVGWDKNSPSYSDARQAKDGVISNRVEIHYPDGRMIGMTSYNGPQEKGAKHTRAKPVFRTEQLLVMAGNKAWKFPGTGVRSR